MHTAQVSERGLSGMVRIAKCCLHPARDVLNEQNKYLFTVLPGDFSRRIRSPISFHTDRKPLFVYSEGVKNPDALFRTSSGMVVVVF